MEPVIGQGVLGATDAMALVGRDAVEVARVKNGFVVAVEHDADLLFLMLVNSQLHARA